MPVPALSEAKFMLYEALRSAGIRKVELARRLRCSPSQVDRLLDGAHMDAGQTAHGLGEVAIGARKILRPQ